MISGPYLQVFWAGDPDVVLGVRAAQDALNVPVSLTEFECTFTLRLIFAPLLGVFPCFGGARQIVLATS